MPIQKPLLSDAELEALDVHLAKHLIAPRTQLINRLVSAANYATAEASGICKYFTLEWEPKTTAGIVSIGGNFCIIPETTFGLFGLTISYRSTLDLSERVEEGTQLYDLKAQGGAINDFQVFFPLNWYVKAATKIYLHFYAINARVAVGTDRILGHVTFGVLDTRKK